MSENLPLASDADLVHQAEEQSEDIIIPPKRSLIARLGCGLLVLIWFIFLLAPCFLIHLATGGELRIWHSDIPEPYEHPRLLVELITEIDYRGLRVVNSSVVDQVADDDAMCVQTNVRYLFWQSEGDSQNATYCDCYTQMATDTEWTFSEAIADACSTSP